MPTANTQKGNPPTCLRTRHCPGCYRGSFFRRSRLFFREAAFSSGGEGCEWGAKQPTVSSEWGYNGENSFSALSPFAGSRKGFSPHIPASRLFVLFHPSQAISPTKKKEHSLLVLPLVHTIINFATKFFEMFTKLQSEHPHKVFQVFQVFRANNPRLTKRAQRATNTTTPRCSSLSVCRISRR